MTILVAPDSFKESLNSLEVCRSIEKGILKVDSSYCVKTLPFSDGGEGALELLEHSFEGEIRSCETVNSSGQLLNARYFKFKEKPLAWIELSRASGLHLIPEKERDVLSASTFGTGIQLKHALENGCTEIILGVGGSATNDGGAGILEALGVGLYDEDGNRISRGGKSLNKIKNIVVPEELKNIKMTIACDVENPLIGSEGASFVYGPQKGASKEEMQILDENLNHFGKLIQQVFNRDCIHLKGSGAAGGTAGGLFGVLNAQLKSGFDLFAELIDLDAYIKTSDLIITAEGKLDNQSLNGKVPISLAKRAKHWNKPLIVLTGSYSNSTQIEKFYQEGISGIFTIQNGPMTLKQSKEQAAQLIEELTSRVIYLIKTLK